MMKTETSVNASKRINIYSQASIDESTNSTNHRTINDHSQKPYNENYSEDGFIPIFRTSKLQRCLSETDPSKKEIIESYFENKISRKPQQLDYPTFTVKLDPSLVIGQANKTSFSKSKDRKKSKANLSKISLKTNPEYVSIRNEEWHTKKEKRLALLRQLKKEKNLAECTFRPEIHDVPHTTKSTAPSKISGGDYNRRSSYSGTYKQRMNRRIRRQKSLVPHHIDDRLSSCNHH